MKNIKKIVILFLVIAAFVSCNDDDDFALQETISAPSDLNVLFDIAQDDSGEVTVTPTGTGASSFELFFGDVENEIATPVNQGETVTHIYGEGDFVLRIVGIGVTGLTSEISRDISITFDPPTDLEVGIEISATNPFEITVTPSATNAVVFDVFFGDVENEEPTIIMAGETINHIYAEADDYTVQVIARGAGAATIDFSQVITILGNIDPIVLPITFDEPTVNFAFTTFGGASFEVVANPNLSGSNDVASNVGAITNSGNQFEGGFFNLGTPVDFSGDNRTITMNFFSTVPVPILLKFEGGVNGERENEVVGNHGGTGWEEVSFNFATDAVTSFIDNNDPGGEPFVPDGQYSILTLFIDGPGNTAATFFIDDIMQIGNTTTTTSGNLLINGDFEAGVEPWTAGVGTDPAPIVTENGNSFYSVNVETAGDVFSVNLSQTGLTIVSGTTYTLTFDAWSDQNRSIFAGIGLSGGDFSNVNTSVDLTTELQTFALTFTVDGFGDDNSRVLFDVGGDVGLVNIDNVSLAIELLTNGDFEAGAEPWTNGVEAFNGSPAPIVTENGNTFYSVNVDNPDPAQPFLVNLSQQGLTLVDGTNYILTFDAWSDLDRSIIAGIGESSGDFVSVPVDINLTDQLQTFTLNLTADGFGGNDIRVFFDSNGEAGMVNIDNVSLVEGGDGSDTP